MKSLNEVFSSLSARRALRGLVVRLGLSNGEGACWFRYLLLNPGLGRSTGDPRGMRVQVWATWFSREGKPQSLIEGFPLAGLELSAPGQNPFHFRIGKNSIDENSCRGALDVEGHVFSWDLHYRSALRVTLSDKGWIGVSRTPFKKSLVSRGEKVPTYIPQANEIAKKFAEAAGGTAMSTLPEILFDVPGTAHCIGGCVIADCSAHGVVDDHHRVFGYTNMSICDGLVVAANLGVNPSPTIAALTERAMSFIAPAADRNYQ